MPCLVELCRRIETNNPPIEILRLGDLTLTNSNQYIDVELKNDKGEDDDSAYEDEEEYKDCSLNSPEQWKALGKAVASNSTIVTLELEYDNHLVLDVVKPETKECLSEFYSELKKSKSIQNLILEFTHQPEAFDLLG